MTDTTGRTLPAADPAAVARTAVRDAKDAGGGTSTRLGTWLTLPAQLLILFVAVFPLLMQLYLSFTDWTPLSGRNWTEAYTLWAGTWNYEDVFADDRFWGALGRTLLIVVVAVPVEFLLGLGLATLFMDEFPGKRVLYSIMLVPMMIVPAVAGYMFYLLFQSDGPINGLLSAISGQDVAIRWLTDPDLAIVAVMIADIWQWTPLMFLILLAGLLGVPQDQLKAATLLGAGPWQRFRTIVLPKIKTIIVIALAIRVIEIFKIFDTLFIMTAGGPGVATETISVFFYKIMTLELAWSYVAAAGLVVLVGLSVVAGVAMAFLPKPGKRA
ncbi:sugar ABC transporter permease [Jannaschia sp. LMIT008]|uniref:carbohydrate ABC transporter permease n=1 Tax=Jannaschia maritima TaxID=3032585 RepID=UPI0028120445|nr:sugar ABC transporter permease [Jannaschia sp. LMIT008]